MTSPQECGMPSARVTPMEQHRTVTCYHGIVRRVRPIALPTSLHGWHCATTQTFCRTKRDVFCSACTRVILIVVPCCLTYSSCYAILRQRLLAELSRRIPALFTSWYGSSAHIVLLPSIVVGNILTKACTLFSLSLTKTHLVNMVAAKIQVWSNGVCSV